MIQSLDDEPAHDAQHELAPADIYRRFTHALAHFSDFDNFREALSSAIEADPHLEGHFLLESKVKDQSVDLFEMHRVVVPFRGDATGHYIKIDGRRDAKPFAAEDLQMMGALAGFVSSLVVQAKSYQSKDQAGKILQYLINQLPLGVICFSSTGALIVENKVATRLLGEGSSAIIEKELAREERFQQGRVQIHFEVEGKLIYAEGRRLEIDEEVSVFAYVLYDLSSQRNKLFLDLEREAYRCESRGIPVSLALIEYSGHPGSIYRQLKELAKSLHVDASKVQPLDAYSCACIFEGKSLRSVRFLMKQILPIAGDSDVSVGIVSYEGGADAPALELVESAREQLLPLKEALLPELLVLDAYPAVLDSLQIILSDHCRVREAPEDVDSLAALIRSGRIDGIFYDLDSQAPHVLVQLKEAAEAAGGGFKFYYCTYKRPSMIELVWGLTRKDLVLQKPFDANQVAEAVALQFDLA